MQRQNFYDRQLVGIPEFNQLQDDVENLIDLLSQEVIGFGVISGLELTPGTGMVANLSTGVALLPTGRRASLVGALILNLANDYNNQAITMPPAGQERYISIQACLVKDQSNQVITPLNETIYYTLKDYLAIKIVAGANAAVGTATPPLALANHIILGDILYGNAQTQVASGNIKSDRRDEVTSIPEVLALMGVNTIPMARVEGLGTALAGKADYNHNHSMNAIQGLETALDGKAASAHSHAQSDITGLETALSALSTAISGKAASVHSHASDTWFTDALSGKSDTSHSHTLGSLGAAAASHTHSGADVSYTDGSDVYKASVVSGVLRVTKQ